MRGSFTALAACLVLGLAATGCEDDASEKDGDAARVIGEGDQYVAFGDSYTAAPGTGPFSRDDNCAQTTVNYPHQIAEELGLELQDHSCNGATTEDVVGAQTTPRGLEIQGPQIDGVDEDTDLVTFRLGANDFGLIARIFGCAAAYAKGNLGDSPDPCTTLDASSPQGPAAERFDDLARNVEGALQAIRDRAPNAEVIVIGYPQIVPPSGSCDQLPLAPGDEAWARGIVEGFNDALQAGADAIGATYVDMFEPSAGHDTCAEDPWMAGLTVVGGGAVVFHPYAAEGEAVAARVLEELGS
ncbi:SGNH/GDSL hydrolase family protein [Nocardioides stalactiti]|uniref:SGNH/GDSL hydrolase family protein n=1 Tax=Nocardioides stalactiti TaxID=2755356 RepID=UPI00160154B9|nr:SGNH/GDSL hydrolase family protein [Nocardioides stalactiti]